MKCPYCSAPDTKVLDSRNSEEGCVIRRRRKCETCQKRFTTFETVELSMPMVIKRDGRREPYNKEKINHGIQKSCEKRPISAVQIERIINNIEKAILDISDKEIQSKEVGNLVMMYLRHLDPVAYVRFAAVYRKFQDVEEFVNDLKHDEHNQFKIASLPKDDSREY
ncbi:MAG: transcriptional repressor NrdR [Bdellovibrionales bacterium]|nr:transcriptional repressor NrdR [Bdellovibrionales bacterium]